MRKLKRVYKLIARNQIHIVVFLGVLLIVGFLVLFRSGTSNDQEMNYRAETSKSDDEWKKILTPQQYHVLREKGTDRPFDPNDSLLHEKRKGTYVTADCGEPVFRSETKFDSGTGWPSFWEPIKNSVAEVEDNTLGMKRIEIVGKKCGGHLGHVFDDGPNPTGLRYCINSSALKFIPDPDQ